jgi:hypothetical protein
MDKMMKIINAVIMKGARNYCDEIKKEGEISKGPEGEDNFKDEKVQNCVFTRRLLIPVGMDVNGGVYVLDAQNQIIG